MSVDILRRIRHYGYIMPFKEVMIVGEEKLTYQELDLASDRLAGYLETVCGENKEPIAVYGHKSIYMLICMIACVKSGRAYCPIDKSVPDFRVQAILRQMESPVMLAAEKPCFDFQDIGIHIIDIADIKQILKNETKGVSQEQWVKGEDVFYIIFTSGSTGEPKGVQITCNCLNNYLDWSVNLGGSELEKRRSRFLNQAPFSFDLSVMDLYTCLATGGTLWSLPKQVQENYQLLMQSLEESQVNLWVSTPSFAEICLAEKRFNQELLPGLTAFLFCGETLTNNTARKLRERFPKAEIINTYGPTESTVAVTCIEITEAVCEQYNPLPVGTAKKGTAIEIRDEADCKVSDGQRGEIVIIGDTVSCGYYKRAEQSAEVFFSTEEEFVRGYHTGDEGYIRNGVLYYCGRMDHQIKLHGYRIELEDIEQNLLRLDGVQRAVVIPNVRDGKAKSLSAYVVYKDTVVDQDKMTMELKERLKAYVPGYMIPKKIIFLDDIPINNNGKVDRAALGGMIK